MLAQKILGTINWRMVNKERITPKIKRQVIWGENMMLVKLFLKKGSVVSKHSHPNEQMTYILKGKIKFIYGHKMEYEVILSAGDVLQLSANVPHSAECLEDTIDLDVFTPLREDWLKTGGNAYFSSADTQIPSGSAA